MLKLVVLLPLLACAYGMVCPPHGCDLVDCAQITDCNGKVLKNGGWCGCCDSCLTELAEGALCFRELMFGVPPTSVCGQGLHCNRTTATCEKNRARRDTHTMSKCDQERAKIMHTVQTTHIVGLEVPHCDADGSYAGMQYAGSQAFCVTVNGTTISGYMVNRWDAGQMNCQCARDKYDYEQLGIIGRMFHCDANGNYHPKQCTGSVCYCVDMHGHKATNTASVNIGHMDTLTC